MPLAETGSKLYFVIGCLDVINNMYKFSLNSYLGIFQKALKKADVNSLFLVFFFLQKIHLILLIFYYIFFTEITQVGSKFLFLISYDIFSQKNIN